MFALDSGDYEHHLAEALYCNLRTRVLSSVLTVGRSCDQPAPQKATDNATAPKAFSSSHTHLLQRCRDIEASFQQAASKLFDQQESLPSTDATAALAEQTARSAHLSVQQLAANSDLRPQDKKSAVCDGLRRVLCGDSGIVWPAVVEYVSLLEAVDTILDGAVSVNVMLDELDLAVAYCCLQRYDAALSHAQTCWRLLTSCRPMLVFDASLIKRRVYLIRSICNLVSNPEVACRYAESAAREAGDLPYKVYAIALLTAQHSSGTTPSAVPSPASMTECCVLFHASALRPLELLCHVDTELRQPAVRCAKEKLLRRVSAAASKREFQDINNELERVAHELKQKGDALQLTLVRQVDWIAETAFTAFSRVDSFPVTVQGVRDLCLIAFVLHRALTLGHRVSEVKKAGAVLVSVIDSLWGPEFAQNVSCDALAMMVSVDPITNPLSRSLIRRVCATIQRSRPATTAEQGALAELKKYMKLLQARTEDDDDDQESAHGEDEAWRAVAERFLARMYALHESDDSKFSLLSLLLKCYQRDACASAATRCAALLASLAARMYGSCHSKTMSYTALFKDCSCGVDAPVCRPSWGVHPLLTPVTLQCPTPGAEIYYSVYQGRASAQSATEHCCRYDGPIVLDRVGRITVRTFAMKDGIRSGTIETQFSVEQN